MFRCSSNMDPKTKLMLTFFPVMSLISLPRGFSDGHFIILPSTDVRIANQQF